VVARRKLSEARRIQILDAAVRVIGARGLCDTRIADIAERAGASSALVLYYFGSKDRLLAEALAFADERFYAEVTHELSQIESARDQLVRMIELACPDDDLSAEDSMDDWILWMEMWTRAPRDESVAADRKALDDKWRGSIIDIVRQGQRRGEFRTDVDAEDFAVRFAGLIDGLSVLVVLNDPVVPPRRMREMCLRTASTELGFELPARALRRRRAAAPARRRAAGRVG
jgi:AcrR family transcriptional regulator